MSINNMLVIKATALLVLIYMSLCAAEIRNTFNKQGSTEYEGVYTQDLDNNLFAEIKCENTTKASKPAKCQVSQETLDGKYKATCEVELDNYVIDDAVILRNLDIDKVVILWWSDSDAKEHQFIRHSIVHLSECKVFEANINQKDSDMSRLTWIYLRTALFSRGDGTFDAFYYTEDSEYVRRVTFDVQGNVAAGPTDSFEILQELQSLTVRTTPKKDLHMALFQYEDKTYQFILFKDDGSWDVIDSFGPRFKFFDASGDHDTIRSCRLKGKEGKASDLICKVFNQKENSTTMNKFNVIDAKNFAIHNLANNDFLLAYSNSQGIHVVKYGADGKKHGKLEVLIGGCKIDSEVVEQILMYSNGGEVCVVRLCLNDKEFDATNYCFKNEDIKQISTS